MAETPEGGAAVLRSCKPALIDALSADADYVLQHAGSRGLLSLGEYRRIKALTDPSEKIRDILDCVIQMGRGPAETFLEFLKKADTKKTFPKLSVILEQGKAGSELVTERQMMLVARGVGRNWKQLGIVALGVPKIRLEQIEEENPGNHVMRVFAMLQAWQAQERRNATAARLHTLLSADEYGLPPESIDFLLEPV